MWAILQDKWSNFNMKNDTKVGGVCNLEVKKDKRHSNQMQWTTLIWIFIWINSKERFLRYMQKFEHKVLQAATTMKMGFSTLLL